MANAPEIAVAYVSIVPEIQGFTRQLRQQIVGPAGDAGADAGEAAGSGMADKFKAAAAAAGIAAGAVLAKGITDALEQSKVTKTLQAQLGATSGDAKKYGDVAGKLYSQGITDNFEQGAEAIRAVVNGGLVKPDATNAQLQSIATKMSDVANTFGTDMSMQTQAVSALMKNGLAKNADEALDLITTGFQKLGPNAEDLLETFQEYPRQLQKLGLDAKTSMGLFSQGLKAGARDTDIIADALKEFSIRSIDMSTTSRDAYEALGINAEKMEQKIAKGGKGAQEGLQTVLDKLRKMKDPVERNAAAVGLFGTQAEDLGDSLFALDPSKAVDAVGKTGGAAKKMGDTLRSGPMQQLKVFQRELQQGLVEVCTKYVIPALVNVGKFGISAWGWMKDNQGWLLPFAAGIGAIATAVGVYMGVVKLVALVTKAWAAVQAALNVVMAMNPIGLIVLALIGLAAAIFVAWKRSETFRNVVLSVWGAIQSAALYAWNNVLKPVFTALSAIVVWLWVKIIKPYFGFIVNYWKYVGLFAKALYNTYVKPALDWIGAKAVWLWNKVIKPYFKYIVDRWLSVGRTAKDLYNNYVKPTFDWIAEKAKWLWNKGVKGPFDDVKKGVGLVGKAFGSAKDAVKTAWEKLEGITKKPIAFVINTVYNKGIVGVWNKVATAFGADPLKEFHPKGFARGGILPGMSSWRNGDDQLVPMRRGEGVYVSEAMRDPYERARLHAVNSAAMRGQSLNKFRDQGFAKGGILGWVGNKLQGAGSAAWDGIKKGAGWLKDGLEASARAGVNKVVQPLIDRIPGSSTLWGKAVRGIPNKALDALFGYSARADKAIEASGVGGKGTRQALRFAKAQAGKPYIWGGVGPQGFDCSGFMSAIQNVILGKAANSRLWATGAFAGANAPSGWVRGMKAPFMVGITNAGVGHTAGTLNGVNVESRGGDGVVVGSRARSYKDSLFTDWYGFSPSKKYDNGGWLMPGAQMTANKTGKPEPVFTSGQWSTLSTLAARGADAQSGGIADGTRLVLVTEGASFEAYVDKRADGRIESGLTGPASLGRVL
ncbi:phage tail tape measure protein [Streptomyces rubiginosohelvolus]|uniref:phage tail tape measure protein n=1 Tax=Streptomyces rubiginosohelvolus TaxID=67362 RepID=UPI0033B0B811